MVLKRMAFGLFLATVGMLALVGVAAAAMGGSPSAQEPSASQQQEAEDGWLGVVVKDVNTGTKHQFNLMVDSGAVVAKLVPGGPAEAAGVKAGDVIQAVNGQAVTDTKQFKKGIEALSPGDPVTLAIVRGSDALTITATLGSEPEPARPKPARSQPKREDLIPGLPGIAQRFIHGGVLHAEFQVLGRDGKVVTIALTSGAVSGVTDTTLTVTRKDGLAVAFQTTTDTQVMIAGHRINLAGLRIGTPVLVVEKDGAVSYVIAWPGERLKHPPTLPQGRPQQVRELVAQGNFPPAMHKEILEQMREQVKERAGQAEERAEEARERAKKAQERLKKAQEHAKKADQDSKDDSA
ncbi:MAG: PDZ domain-containing protein [Chloroflexi bacterium]|nr:PDZ domain-containing protein [Chloroflexota bacterium]